MCRKGEADRLLDSPTLCTLGKLRQEGSEQSLRGGFCRGAH